MFRRAKPRAKGTVPEHLRDRFAYLDRLEPANVFAPWQRLGVLAVGGLWYVGFADRSDLLLLISSAGRGVVDCMSAQKLARDDSEYYLDAGSLEADGIGPLEGQIVRVAGPEGGGLTRATTDGWGIELHPISWPEEELFLCPPGHTMLWEPPGSKPALIKLRPLPSTLVAYGFSPTGKSLVIATSSDVEIYGRV
jgi:hypothetical protein